MRVEKVARKRACTPAQLALAWVLAQGSDIVPIPGTKRRRFLDENIAAVDVELTREDLRNIEEVVPQGAASGMRYNAAMMSLIGK